MRLVFKKKKKVTSRVKLKNWSLFKVEVVFGHENVFQVM